MRVRSLICLAIAGLASAAGGAVAKEKTREVPTAQITGDGLEQSVRCSKGGAMRILSNHSRLSVLGDCTVITIVGSRNWIAVEHAERIVFTGSFNDVLYEDATTRVEDRGGANDASERWQQ